MPGVLKDLLYPSASSSKTTVKSNESVHEESSSSDDEEQSTGWLNGKRKSGMKLVYGLLGGNMMAGSPSTAIDFDDEDEDDDDDNTSQPTGINHRADAAEIIDDRIMTNFQKYFVLPETEKLLTGIDVFAWRLKICKLISFFFFFFC